jgi:hypothetical protein
MGTRRTHTRSRPEGGLRRRGRLAGIRRAVAGQTEPPQAPEAAPAEGEPPPSEAEPPPPERSDELRWREFGGPEDRTLYTCGCGYVWEGPVSASVSCPNCGAAQAW